MPSNKSPLEMLANACNKLESDMLLSKRDYPVSSSSSSRTLLSATPSPSPPSSSSYRLPAMMARNGPADTAAAFPQSSPRLLPSAEQPLPLLSRPGLPSPAPTLPKDMQYTTTASSSSPSAKRHDITPSSAVGGGLKIKSAESLSPLPRTVASAASSPASSSTNGQRRPPSALAASSSPSPNSGLPAHLSHLQPPVSSSMTPPVSYLSLGPPGGLSPYSSYLGYFGAAGLAPPPQAGPCLDPMCRDPSCPTFAMRMAQAQLMAAGMSPHHPLAALGYPGYGLGLSAPPGSPYAMFGGQHPGLASLSPYLPGPLLPPPPPPVSTSSAAPPSSQSAGGGGVGSSPYMCSWMQGRDFCGRRFNSSEELMAHLRSHTTAMGPTSSSTQEQFSAAATTLTTTIANSSHSPPVSSSALAMLQAQAQAMRAASPSSSTSSGSPPALSDPRYHPYSRLPPPHLSPAFLSSLYASPRPLMPVLP